MQNQQEVKHQFHSYACPPTDYWFGFQKVSDLKFGLDDLVVARELGELYDAVLKVSYDHIGQHSKRNGGEGFCHDETDPYIMPVVSGECAPFYAFVWKSVSDGTTYVFSPEPLSHLQMYEMDDSEQRCMTEQEMADWLAGFSKGGAK